MATLRMGVILGRSEAQTREPHDEKTLASKMVGSSPTMTAPSC
jgi:hypothetical protein